MHSKGNNAIAADLNFSWIETNHFFFASVPSQQATFIN